MRRVERRGFVPYWTIDGRCDGDDVWVGTGAAFRRAWQAHITVMVGHCYDWLSRRVRRG